MNEPEWVTTEEVARINQKETALTQEPFGIMKPGELASACNRARQHYAYGETDIHRLAAAYAEVLARNHPFEQGNKRAAFAAAAFFLAKNGVQLLPREDNGYVDMVQGLIRGDHHPR